MATKCVFNGEPLRVKHKVTPVPGSVRQLVAGEFRGGSVENPIQGGECPECRAFVPLSSKGFVTAHEKGNSPAPASVALTEKAVEPTDTGARVGDPAAGFQRRTADVDGAFQRGTVLVPEKNEKGRTELKEREATAENVRAALEYWKGRRPRTAGAKDEQSKMISGLTRRLRAFDGATAPQYDAESGTYRHGKDTRGGLFGAKASPEGFTQHMITGAPLVKGRNMAPIQPMRRNKRTGEMETSSIGTMGGSLGRERIDRELLDERDKGHRTPSQRANYRRKMRRLAAKNGRQGNKG